VRRDKYRRLLDEHGTDTSMSHPGDCRGNAAVENFFCSLKTERLEQDLLQPGRGTR